MMNEIKSNKTFTDLYGDHLNNVAVFGNPDNMKDFEAHVKMEFWGENYISFCEEGVKGEPTLKDDIIELDLGKRKLQWLKEGASNLKWIEILNEKPASNKWSLKIADANQFDYFYQTPLAEKAAQIPGSSIEYYEQDGEQWIRLIHPPGGMVVSVQRPLKIDGSIAVYHKTKRDHAIGKVDYKIGKVLYIPRPKAVDAVGKWVWCDIQVENGVYTRTIDQQFLNDAVYPIVINDTFGLTSSGATTQTKTADYNNATGPFSPANDGSATSMSLYTVTGSVSVTLGIYDNAGDGGGSAGDLEKDTAGGDSVANNWTTQDLDSALAVLAASSYWLVENNASNITVGCDEVAGASEYQSNAYSAGSLMASRSAWSVWNYRISLYVTYTPSVGGIPIFRRRIDAA